MEEYSSDEEGIHPVPQTAPLVDPVSFTIIIFYHTLFDLTLICYYQKTLSWIPWIRHNASQALALFDYAGESVADFLGITSPKYSYEIDEAQRMKEDEEKEREARDIEMSGWIEPGKSSQMEFENANNQHLCPESNIPVIVCPPTEQTNSI